MNSDAPRPTLKLSIAFAGMCLLGMDYAIRDLFRGTSGVWMLFTVCVYTPSYLWISWIGVFKSSGLQLLWGWATLLLGSFTVIILVGRLIFGAVLFPHVSAIQLLLPSLLLFTTGWPLVFDHDVRRFRVHLRKIENERCKLRTWD